MHFMLIKRQLFCYRKSTQLFCYRKSNNIGVLSYTLQYTGKLLPETIRYTLQLRTLPLPKTANPQHMYDNAQADFMISDSDMEKPNHMERMKDYGEYNVFPVFSGK